MMQVAAVNGHARKVIEPMLREDAPREISLTQRIAPTGISLGAPQLLYLATRAGAEALELEHEIGDFTAGKSADCVYLRPAAQSPLAAVMRHAPGAEQLLAALFTLAGAETVRETWVAGAEVYRDNWETAAA